VRLNEGQLIGTSFPNKGGAVLANKEWNLDSGKRKEEGKGTPTLVIVTVFANDLAVVFMLTVFSLSAAFLRFLLIYGIN